MAGPDVSQSRGLPRASPDAPPAARSDLEQAHDTAIIEARNLVASARQRLSAPDGFTYTYSKSVKGESEIKSAFAHENFAILGRDSALSLEEGSNPSLMSQEAATRRMAGSNRPVGRPSSGVELGGGPASSHPAHPSKAKVPDPPVPLEPTPSESVSKRGSSRRSAFAPGRGGVQITYHTEDSTRGVNMVGGNGGSYDKNAAALLMNFSNINNPILSQILMETSRPKFQASA